MHTCRRSPRQAARRRMRGWRRSSGRWRACRAATAAGRRQGCQVRRLQQAPETCKIRASDGFPLARSLTEKCKTGKAMQASVVADEVMILLQAAQRTGRRWAWHLVWTPTQAACCRGSPSPAARRAGAATSWRRLLWRRSPARTGPRQDPPGCV